MRNTRLKYYVFGKLHFGFPKDTCLDQKNNSMMNAISTKSIFSVLLLLLCWSSTSIASDYYWVNGTGNWNDPMHWSNSSGGAPSGAVPEKEDNAIIDLNSFLGESSVIYLTSDIEISNLSVESSNYVLFSGETSDITIYGDLDIQSYSSFYLPNNSIHFKNETNSTNKINTASIDFYSDLSFDEGKWELLGPLKTGMDNTIQFNKGKFYSNEYTVLAQNILVNNDSYDLDFTGSYVSATNQFDLTKGNNIGGAATYRITDEVAAAADFDDFSDDDDIIAGIIEVCGDGTTLELELVATSDYNGAAISCTGECDGEITVTATGTPGPYAYRFGGPPNPFEADNVFIDQCAGSKTIFVMDSSIVLGPDAYYVCRIDLDLLEPNILSFTPLFTTNPTCYGICDGSATISLDGGTGDLDIIWPIFGETTDEPVMLCAGANPYTVTDENGCTISNNLIMAELPPILAEPTINGPTCNGDCDASILINPSGGNGEPFTFLWSPVPPTGATVNPAEDLCSGTYNVTIFDDEDCGFDTTIIIIDPPILTLTVDDIIDATCNGTCDGQATVNPSGGVGPYSYEWFDNATGLPIVPTTQTVTTFCAGEYFVSVTDAIGCVIFSPPFTINEPAPFVFNVDVYPVSCFGLCDGSADIDITGGTGDYTFSWISIPGGVGIGATDSISGLCPGEYQIIVTDENLCTTTPVIVEVIEPTEVDLTISGTNPTCYDICDGTATVVASGGTPGYTYSWSPLPITGSTTPNVSNLCGDMLYTVLVTDDNGCEETAEITLDSPTEYEITSVVSDLACFGDTDGAIDLTIVTGGSGVGYTFNWAPTPPVGDGTGNVSGLGAGTWVVIVADSEGCDTTLTFDITSPPELIVTTSIISEPTCNDLCDGSAEAVITGGVEDYTILWSDPDAQTTLVANGLCAGTFNVTVTDFLGCESIQSVTLTEPDEFDITTSQVDLDCFGDCDGTATVVVNSGGTEDYDIIWDDDLAQTTFTAVGLCALTYEATITDANLCDTTITFTFTEPTEILAPLFLIDSTCFGLCTGSAYVDPSGGTGGYTFEWFDAATDIAIGTNDTIDNLCVGDYYVIVTDANGCTVQSENISIFELPEIIASIVSTTDATCSICDGAAEITATGGDGDLTFDWDPDPLTGDGTTSVTGLCSGTYTVDITDGTGCLQILTVSIDDIALEEITLDSVNVTCFGDCDGQVSVSFIELDPPYVIEWFDNATGASTTQFGNTAIDLCAGEYLAVVTNASGCVTTGTISLIEPEEITAIMEPTDVSCTGLCDGAASVIISGGVPPYTYDWGLPLPGTGEGTPNVNGLCAGPWQVEVLDDGGCLVIFNTVIDEPTSIFIDAEASTGVSCFGDSDGTASVIVSGATGPFTYEWFDCATGLPIGQTDPLATGLPPGDYECVITDANGCTSASTCIPVADAPPITAIINTENISCYGECDGLMYVVPSGGAAIYFFQWLDADGNPIPGQTNDSLENACSGNYNLEITDLNGCSQIFGPIDMTAPSSPWDVVVSQTNISCSGSCDGTASVVVLDGNNPPYTYLWDDDLPHITPTANFLCEDTYSVTISDAGVCDTTITFEIVNNNPIFANIVDMNNIICSGECNGDITVDPFGGVGPYTLNWTDGQTGTTATGLCSGLITLFITDAAGCTIDTTFNVTENPALTIASSFSNNTTCGICNGSATVNVVGGIGAYTYDWDPDPTAGEGTNNATGLCPGVIAVTITDALGCSITETFGISDIPTEVITLTTTDASCFGICDGTANADFACTVPTCTQAWFDGVTGDPIAGETSTSITGLCAGDYFIEVTNGDGCITIEPLTINSPTEIIANETITSSTCSEDNDATIVLAPTGGSGAGYTYFWSPVPPNGDGTNEALDLGPGLWEVTVVDGNGCSQLFSFDIVNPIPMEIAVDLTDPTCTGFCNGSILASITGGGGGFTFQWFEAGVLIPGETSPLLTALCAGDYNVIVTDINGCTATLPADVTLNDPIPISASITSTDITCFGLCDGIATVTISGGESPYSVNWHDAVTGDLIGIAGPTATGLCEGSYFAIITDNNGCTFTSSTITIVEPTELTATLTTVDNACFGFCDGSGAIVAAGGTPVYAYEWLNIAGDPLVGGTTPNVEDLCDGNYTVEVTDTRGCTTGLIPVVINGFDEIVASLFSNDADCGVANGNASAFASGGNAPYTFQWFDITMTELVGETDNTLIDVFSGIYFVTVTDANGCSETFMATISDGDGPDVTFDAINHPSCFESCDGSIEITASGFSPPFIYSWNPEGLIDQDPTGLCAGDYLLEISDNLGCTSFYDTTLVNPDQIIISSTITSTECGLCNGAIDLILSGGTGALSVVWNTGETTTSISDLCSGVYEATVTDGNGCTRTQTFTVTNSSGLTIDPVVNAITCSGACDGEITVSGVGGTAPYTYFWLHDGSTAESITGLCAATYFVQVTDALGCINTIEIELLNPSPIDVVSTMANPSCGASDGSITIMTSGGILPHTYLWSTGATLSSISGLPADIYTVTITDDNGCTTDLTIPLNNLTAPAIELVSTPVNCFGDCNGTIDTLHIVDGTPGFNFKWLDESGTELGVTTPLITDLCVGEYILEVTDAAGCISFETGTITSPDTVLGNPLITTPPLCNGGCDGTIISNPFGGTLPYTFLWDDDLAQTTREATGLCAGVYNLIVSDANGCSIEQTATILEPTPLSIIVDSITPATCYNSNDGQIEITTTGGTPGYIYEWTNNVNADIFITEDPINLMPFTYYLMITDANGCEYFDTIHVDTLIQIMPNAGPDTSICNYSSLLLTGTSNIETGAIYTWMDTLGNILSDSTQLFIPISAEGNMYYVLQVDYMGCQGYDTVIVTTRPPVFVDAGDGLDLLPTQTHVIGGDPTTDLGNTVIWTPPINLSETDVTNPSVIKPEQSTMYYVEATDIYGCTNIDSIYVTVLPELEIPDGISPNGDGKNDTWILDFIDQYPGVSIKINVYNRWGELLFASDETYNDDWAGLTEDGKRLPAGTYYFVIDVDHEDFPDPITGPLTIMW